MNLRHDRVVDLPSSWTNRESRSPLESGPASEVVLRDNPACPAAFRFFFNRSNCRATDRQASSLQKSIHNGRGCRYLDAHTTSKMSRLVVRNSHHARSQTQAHRVCHCHARLLLAGRVFCNGAGATTSRRPRRPSGYAPERPAHQAGLPRRQSASKRALPTRQAADKAARASSCKRHQILTTRDAPTDDNWPAFHARRNAVRNMLPER